MIAGEMRVAEGRRHGGDLLRRGILTALAVYLVPAALAVLLVGAVGLACCAALRLAIGGPVRPEDGRSRCHASARVPGPWHLCAAARSRRSSC